MNKSILIAFTIIAGLAFSSCKNTKSDDRTNGETAITAGTKSEDSYSENEIDELIEKVKQYINNTFLTEADKRAISEDQKKFHIYTIDLNNDGNEEVFVNFGTSYFCGSGGCTVLLLDSNIELITRFSPTQALYIEETEENGWKVLLTETEGSWRKLIYENGTYPSNPTMVDAKDEQPSNNAVKVFDEDNTKQKTYSF